MSLHSVTKNEGNCSMSLSSTILQPPERKCLQEDPKMAKYSKYMLQE